jgi:putative flippase GtrA
VQLSRPAPRDQGWLKARISLPERVLEWLERHENAALVGPLFAYARAHAAQLAHFVLIGACLAALNLSFLYCFRTLLHLPDPIAVTAMYVLGAVPHFTYHRYITYRAQDQPLRPQGLRYAVMLLSNFVIMQLMVGLASRASISPYVAVMSSTACTMVASFLLMTHIVFAKGRRP